MKKLIIFILLLSLMVPAMSRPKEPIKIGYWIVVSKDCKHSKPIKTESLTEVYTIAETVFPGNCLQFEKVLKNSPYFDIGNSEKGIYVEKKRINKNGKYRRLR